jgi:hypothetical protein
VFVIFVKVFFQVELLEVVEKAGVVEVGDVDVLLLVFVA